MQSNAEAEQDSECVYENEQLNLYKSPTNPPHKENKPHCLPSISTIAAALLVITLLLLYFPPHAEAQ